MVQNYKFLFFFLLYLLGHLHKFGFKIEKIAGQYRLSQIESNVRKWKIIQKIVNGNCNLYMEKKMKKIK